MNRWLFSFCQKRLSPVFLVTATLVMFLSSFRVNKMNDDIWRLLGITPKSGNEKIKSSFMHGYLYYYGVKNIKSLVANDRATIASNLLSYTKQYVTSDAFRKEYDEMRKQEQPPMPELKSLRSIEKIQRDEITTTEKSIREMEKNRKDLPQFAKSIEPMLTLLKDNLKKLQDPKNSYFAAIALGEKYEQENEIKRYSERMEQWEEDYPPRIDRFIASRLQKMLDDTRDIDFNAQLIEKEGKKKFVNPAYESKNAEWKQGFRAGKEITEMTRAFAANWLAEIKAN
ncbi:MAG TPA: hypothetical protein VFI06_11090 [Chitinophagaceae bacterium]|nr:hypothetical protein [Chitinophagaceae bacterium]